MMIVKEYPITAMGKPRMTRADKWKQRPEVMRYRAFKDEVRLHKVSLPESGYHITFVLPKQYALIELLNELDFVIG